MSFDKLVTQAKKDFGEDRVTRGDETPIVDRISSGIPSLDLILGGGYPIGGMTMIYGAESVGKSALTYAAIAEVHRNNGYAALIDLEASFHDGEEDSWPRILGVDPERVLVFRPRSAEEVMENAVFCAEQEILDITVLDSIGAMASERELAEDGKKQAFGQSGLITQMVKQIGPRIADSEQAFIVINQVRDGQTGMPGVVKLKPPGGHALLHTCAVMINLRKGRSENIHKHDKAEVGFRPIAYTEKNKVGSPKKTAEFDIYHTDSPLHPKGIDYLSSLVFAAINTGVIQRSGPYYSIPALEFKQDKDTTGIGQDNLIKWIRATPELAEGLKREFYASLDEEENENSGS